MRILSHNFALVFFNVFMLFKSFKVRKITDVYAAIFHLRNPTVAAAKIMQPDKCIIKISLIVGFDRQPGCPFL